MLGLLNLVSLLAASSVAGQSNTDIIVTGEKRQVPLQATTSSVAIYSSTQIEDGGYRELQELYDRTANVAPAFGSGGFSIRGITNFGVTIGSEAATSTVYLDDIPMASTFLQAAPTQLWDVQQVEIFRGPQSTLQGLNALAGAVMIRSVDPSLGEWQARGRMDLTDQPERRLAFALGGPIVQGQLAFRLSAEASSRDGYIRNVTRKVGEDQEHSATLKGKLLWVPSRLPGLQTKLSFIHAGRKGPYFSVYARTDVPNFLRDPVATDNVANTTNLLFDAANLEAQYHFGNGVSLVSESIWSHVRETSQFDGDYGPANLAYSHQQRTYRTLTQELRLVANAPSLKGVVGFYFYDRDLASGTTSRTSVPTPIGTIATFLRGAGASRSVADAIAQAYGTALPSVSVDFSGSFPTHVRTYSAYGDVRVRLSSGIFLLAGFRGEHEINETQTIQRSSFSGTFPNPAEFGPLAPVFNQINAAVGGLVAQANGTLPIAHRTFDIFLPKIGAAIDLATDVEAALVVQKAYRSGGSSGNIARGQAFAYAPETTWNYEASIRSLLAGGKMRLNANAFYVDWRQQQVAVNFGLNAYDVNVVNAGKSHLYGFEFETAYWFRPSWSTYFSIGHTRTKFDQFIIQASGAASNLSGSEFAFAPRWTVSAGTDIRLANGWGGALNAAYSSRSFGTTGVNQSNYRVSPHATVNLRLGHDAKTWSIHALCNNAFDGRHVVYKSPAENRAVISAPRTVGLEIAARY